MPPDMETRTRHRTECRKRAVTRQRKGKRIVHGPHFTNVPGAHGKTANQGDLDSSVIPVWVALPATREGVRQRDESTRADATKIGGVVQCVRTEQDHKPWHAGVGKNLKDAESMRNFCEISTTISAPRRTNNATQLLADSQNRRSRFQNHWT